MRPFSYSRETDAPTAVQSASIAASSHVESRIQYLGGGTTLLDLMKLDVMQPDTLVDITGLTAKYATIAESNGTLRIGALARMADVAESTIINRDYPVLAQTMQLAASQQLRNMARAGGNVLQRTRCNYFRDTSYTQCNKRDPGSGCAALDGFSRLHAILGTSASCIATYPGDWAQGLIALDAAVEILGKSGPRVIKFADLHRLPGNTPHIETNLQPGELITAFTIQSGPWPVSHYQKSRDRESYEFGLATAAVALKMNGDTVQDARIALGGVATKPWRAAAAEASLRGRALDEDAASQAAEIAFAGARTTTYNAFKLPLGKATLVRALLQAKEIVA